MPGPTRSTRDSERLVDALDPEVSSTNGPTLRTRTYHGWMEFASARRHGSSLGVAAGRGRRRRGTRRPLLITLRQRSKGRGSALEIETKTFALYTFRNDKVKRGQFFTDREAALEAAGLTANLEEEKKR